MIFDQLFLFSNLSFLGLLLLTTILLLAYKINYIDYLCESGKHKFLDILALRVFLKLIVVIVLIVLLISFVVYGISFFVILLLSNSQEFAVQVISHMNMWILAGALLFALLVGGYLTVNIMCLSRLLNVSLRQAQVPLFIRSLAMCTLFSLIVSTDLLCFIILKYFLILLAD